MSKRLREAGFTEPQADAVATVINEVEDGRVADLVTKVELLATKNDLEIALTGAKSDLRLEIAGVKADVVLLKWMAGLNTAMMIAILLKLFAP